MYLSWRFFQKNIFPVFILAPGAVRTMPSSCRHIFMRSFIWHWWAFAKKRQIKNHAKLTSYTVLFTVSSSWRNIRKLGFNSLTIHIAIVIWLFNIFDDYLTFNINSQNIWMRISGRVLNNNSLSNIFRLCIYLLDFIKFTRLPLATLSIKGLKSFGFR